MKVRSAKLNFFLNTLRVVSSTLIGVFTMPYINKTLGPVSLGKVEYVNAIINYFIMFSALGIPMYAVKQIAKVRDNIVELSKNSVEILGVLFVNTVLSYGVMYVIYLLNQSLWDYRDIIFLMSSMVLLTNLGAEWFFQGVEDQLYITVRYVIIRIITLVVLFVFIKGPEDYFFYALIVVLNVCGSNFFNILKLFKIIQLKGIRFSDLNFTRHIRPSLTIFIAAISVNVYVQIDTLFLGSIAGDEYVGYYSVANKLIRYIILFITIIGSVMLPRLSNLWVTNQKEYYRYLSITFNVILCLSLPFFGYFLIFSENIIGFMAGEEFNLSILTMQILSPLCVIVGIAYYLGYLVLYPQDKEKYYTIAVSLSAFVSIVLNYFMISAYKHNGAAITQVISELVAIMLMVYFIRKSLSKLGIEPSNVFKIFIVCIFVPLLHWLLIRNLDMGKYTDFQILLVGSSTYFVLVFLFLLFAKEKTVLTYSKLAIKYIKLR